MIVPAAPVGGIDHRQRFGCTRNRIHLLVTPSWAPLQKDICGGALHRSVRFHIQSCDYVFARRLRWVMEGCCYPGKVATNIRQESVKYVRYNYDTVAVY